MMSNRWMETVTATKYVDEKEAWKRTNKTYWV